MCEAHYHEDLMDLDTEGLFKFRGLYMCNDDPDLRVMEFSDAEDVYDNVVSLFGEDIKDVVEITTANKRNDASMCDRFYFVLGGYKKASVPNYRLETFLHAIGEDGVDARCHRVMVLGATLEWMCRRFVSIPERYFYQSMEIGAVLADPDLTLDFNEDVVGIQGMSLPCHLPEDVQWRILSYCRSPTAQLIHDYNEGLTRYWDSHFCSLSWLVNL